MNKFLLLFIITFAYVYVEGESSEKNISSSEGFVDRFNLFTIYGNIIQLIDKVEKQCPDIDHRFNPTFEEVDVCLQNVTVGDNTLCTFIRNNLVRCFDPITRVVEGCLPQKSRRVAILGAQIIQAFIDQACNSTLEQILELFNPCITKMKFTSFPSCVKVQNVLEQHRDQIPSTASVCSTLPLLESCERSHREASCSNPITRSAMLNFYDAIDTTVAEECQMTNETN